MKRIVVACLLNFVVAPPLLATDVINQDGKAYKITVVDGSYTSSSSVGPKSSAYGLCSQGPCTIKIEGASIGVSKDDKVVISGGRLRKL